MENHKSGFVNIIGKPNVGKSTLMNSLMGEKLSIVTSKAQTTRHRIMGIWNEADFQVVYSDTPGILKPAYELHSAMMKFVSSSLEDADVVLFIADIYDKDLPEDVIARINRLDATLFLIINKTDLAKDNQAQEALDFWRNRMRPSKTFFISALTGENIEALKEAIIEALPVHPPYFPKDEFTDRTERFFASEIIRENILQQYKEEIPYCCEVIITSFKEKEDILVINSLILVERETQKGIVIGKGGEAIKKLGIKSREALEVFFNKKIFLEQSVKVEPDWRSKATVLSRLGY